MRLKKTNAALVSVAGLAAVGVGMFSLFISFRFGSGFGATWTDQMIMGGIAACLDGFKMMLPVLAGVLWVYGRKVWSAAAWAFWLPIACFAVLQSYGYFVTNRADSGVYRQAQTAIATDTTDEIKHLKAKRIKAEKLEFRYTKRCSTAKSQRWRSCKTIDAAIKNLGSSREISAQLDKYRGNRSLQPRATVRSGEDPQLAAFNRLSGLDFFNIMSIISFIFGIAIEVVGAVGMAFVSMSLAAIFGHKDDQIGEFLTSVDEVVNELVVDVPEVAPVAVVVEHKAKVKPVPEVVAPEAEEPAELPVKGLLQAKIDETTVNASTGWLRTVLSDAERDLESEAPVEGAVVDFVKTVNSGDDEISGVAMHDAYKSWCADNDRLPVQYGEFHQIFGLLLVSNVAGAEIEDSGRGRRFGDNITYKNIALSGDESSVLVDVIDVVATVVEVAA